MPLKPKASPEEKVLLLKRYFSGEIGLNQAAGIAGVHKTSFWQWIKKYDAEGSMAFLPVERPRVHTPECRRQAIKEYLSGDSSPLEICKKYKLRSTIQLKKWVREYNSGKDFKPKVSRGNHMKNVRKTTQEERIQIVRECLNTDCNYAQIALKYGVSRHQVYDWVKKFTELGEAGLEDRRGKRTADQEPRTELEELKIQVAQLKRENYRLQMERDLLKKLEELERRDLFRK